MPGWVEVDFKLMLRFNYQADPQTMEAIVTEIEMKLPDPWCLYVHGNK